MNFVKLYWLLQQSPCELDPLPTKLLKPCLDPVLPSITDIVNKSLSEIRFKPQQSIFGNASGIFQTIEKYLMVNGIKRCR
jgi:hypothetical protein